MLSENFTENINSKIKLYIGFPEGRQLQSVTPHIQGSLLDMGPVGLHMSDAQEAGPG